MRFGNVAAPDWLYRPILSSNPLFWGDLHLWHACLQWEVPLWASRGFGSASGHALGLEDRWRATVTQDDDICLVGDTALGAFAEERLSSLLSRLPFRRLYLMPGNHPAGYRSMAENVDVLPRNVFLLPNYVDFKTKHGFFAVSHYPILSWNRKEYGSIMVHGHCHGKLHNTYPWFYAENSVFDVGVDVEPHPVSASELAARVAKRQRTHEDEDRQTQDQDHDQTHQGADPHDPHRPDDIPAARPEV